MSRYYPAWNGIQLLPEDLIKFAWSEPMRDLATKVGISDVGLRKLFVSMGIVPPPQGYWNKLRAGKPVPEIPRTPPRQPGTTGRLLVDRRFEHFVPQAQPFHQQDHSPARWFPKIWKSFAELNSRLSARRQRRDPWKAPTLASSIRKTCFRKRRPPTNRNDRISALPRPPARPPWRSR